MDKGQIDEVRKRTSLQVLVAANVALQRRGRRYVGLCPFHKEKTPSFHVVEDEGFYYCFGCAERGDAFDWLQKMQGMSFVQALEQLAKQAGVVLQRKNETAQARTERESGESLKAKQRERLLQVMKVATLFYQQELLAPVGAQARAYLRARAIDKTCAQRFALGWADGDARRFFEYMKQQNCSHKELFAAGLTISNERAPQNPRARFRSRIIFPIDDRQGRTIAFGGRLLEKNNAQNQESNNKNSNEARFARFVQPKYLNSPETLLFSKGRSLYNFARAREAVRGNFARREKERAVLVEGYMDAIALDKFGCSASVASLGTAISEQQLALLWQLADEPVLCFDGDRAGGLAATRAVKKALPLINEGKSLRVFFLPQGEDPDSFVNKFGAQRWHQALATAETVSAFLWRVEKAEREPIDTPEKLASLDKALEQHSQSIVANTLQKHYRDFFKDALFQQRRLLNINTTSADFIQLIKDEDKSTRARQEMLVILLAKNPDLWDAYEERFACLDLPQDLDAVRQAMLVAYANASPDEDIARLLWQSGGAVLHSLCSLASEQHYSLQNSYSNGQSVQEIVGQILTGLDHGEIGKDLAQAEPSAREQAIALREDARRISTQQ